MIPPVCQQSRVEDWRSTKKRGGGLDKREPLRNKQKNKEDTSCPWSRSKSRLGFSYRASSIRRRIRETGREGKGDLTDLVSRSLTWLSERVDLYCLFRRVKLIALFFSLTCPIWQASHLDSTWMMTSGSKGSMFFVSCPEGISEEVRRGGGWCVCREPEGGQTAHM